MKIVTEDDMIRLSGVGEGRVVAGLSRDELGAFEERQ